MALWIEGQGELHEIFNPYNENKKADVKKHKQLVETDIVETVRMKWNEAGNR